MSKQKTWTFLEKEVFTRGANETYEQLSASLGIPSLVLRDIYDSAFEKWSAWKKQQQRNKINNYWQPWEVNILSRAFAEDMDAAEVAALLPERSVVEIRDKLRVFREKRAFPQVYTAWTPQDDKRLIQEYKNGEPLRIIAGHLHKSRQAVATRLTKLRKAGILKCAKRC